MRPPIAPSRQPGALRRYLLGGGLGPFLVRATAGSGAVHAAGMLLAFLVGLQLARGLGVEGYGHYGIAMAVIAVISIPGEFGLPRLVTREVAAASASKDLARLFGVISWADRMSLTVALPLALVIAVGGFLVTNRDSSPVAVAIAAGAPIIPLVALAKIRGAALQGLHFIVRGQIPFRLLRPLAFSILLFVLFALWPEAGAAEAMALNGITAAISLLVGYLWLRNRLPPRPQSVVQTRGWLASSIPMALSDGMRIMQLNLVVLILGLMIEPEQVGLFRVAASTVIVVATPIVMMNFTVSPVMAKLFAEGDMRRLQQVVSHTAQVMTLAIAALTLPFLLWGGPLLSFAFGEDFAPALPALLILCVGQIMQAAFGPGSSLLMMTGHEKRVTRASATGLMLSIVSATLLIPYLGILGAAIASSLALTTWSALTWRDARRLLALETSLLPTGTSASPGREAK